MNNFYPGPSKLYPQVREWLIEIYDSGILAKNHRSDAFMQLWSATDQLLRNSLNIPADYEIYITSSATECWEIVNQSLISGEVSYAYNGAFGKKWAIYGRKYKGLKVRSDLNINEINFGLNATCEEMIPASTNTICLTHNETSNGSCLPDAILECIRKNHPEALIAVDATSSMAGTGLPWNTADVWFASVQKCFGLPSGMAVMVASPRSVQRAEEVSDNSFYNSLLNIRANFQKNQTPYTPNILGVALLNKQTAFVENIDNIDRVIRGRASNFYQFITNETPHELLIKNEAVRSPTVFTVEVDPVDLQRVITVCEAKGITLGKGYGEWKNNTFRVANFPSITDLEFENLKDALRDQ